MPLPETLLRQEWGDTLTTPSHPPIPSSIFHRLNLDIGCQRNTLKCSPLWCRSEWGKSRRWIWEQTGQEPGHQVTDALILQLILQHICNTDVVLFKWDMLHTKLLVEAWYIIFAFIIFLWSENIFSSFLFSITHFLVGMRSIREIRNRILVQ